MGKLIGALIGMLFGPLGIIFGLMIGAIFDSKARIYSGGFFSSNIFSNNVFFNSFPVLAAEVTRAGGVKKETVLTVKNITLQLFGKENASIMMGRYKSYVESGYSPYLLEETCENILYNVDHQSKIYLISTLFTILKSSGVFSPEEIFSVQTISRKIGLSAYEFESMLRHFRSGSFGNNTFYEEGNAYHYDAYKILELDPDASVQDIKKQYRNLSKRYHPDLNANLSKLEREKAEVKMRQINDAYEVLKREKNIR